MSKYHWARQAKLWYGGVLKNYMFWFRIETEEYYISLSSMNIVVVFICAPQDSMRRGLMINHEMWH
jgi:hypothetical protein